MRLILLQPVLLTHATEQNCHEIESLVYSVKNRITPDDILLLPEHFTFSDDTEKYDSFIRHIAKEIGCIVVGGSHHRNYQGNRVNYGSVVDSGGRIVAEYTKLRPYFNEIKHVSPGSLVGEILIKERKILILVCADFWYSDVFFKARELPDVVLVPALSVSRKPQPDYSRALWRYFAIQRAYEFGFYVGISDWSADSVLSGYRTCGVGGFADPTVVDPDKLFTGISDEKISFFDLDFEALERFRDDRKMRGFFWK